MIDSVHERLAGLDPRIALAAERTLLAWVRTGLAMMGFGFVVGRFGVFLHEAASILHAPARPASGLSLWIGSALIVLGVLVNVMAAARHVRFMRGLERDALYRPNVCSMGVIVTLLLAAVGVVMAAYMIVASA